MRTLCALCGLLAVVLTARAGPRTSTNYSITTEVLDGGGRVATSSSYSQAGSAGTIVGTSQNVSPSEIARHGYVGQLYDLTSLILSASATNVASGSNTQLSAIGRLDDGTTLVLLATQVVWSVVGGPITGISSNGVATAGTVSQDTAATVRGDSLGQFGTLQLTVLAAGPQRPRILSFSLSGTNGFLSGTNGTLGGNYYVLSHTNVAAPLATWTSIATNNFDSGGNFNLTIPIIPGERQRFYLIEIP